MEGPVERPSGRRAAEGAVPEREPQCSAGAALSRPGCTRWKPRGTGGSRAAARGLQPRIPRRSP
jgi:hypothetical protein